jgi:hypothetical protein
MALVATLTAGVLSHHRVPLAAGELGYHLTTLASQLSPLLAAPVTMGCAHAITYHFRHQPNSRVRIALMVLAVQFFVEPMAGIANVYLPRSFDHQPMREDFFLDKKSLILHGVRGSHK